STHDSSLIISSKIDSLLDEFAGELTLLKSIPPGIDKTDCHPENEIHLTKRLLYDKSSPRPPEEFVYENSDAKIESFSPSPIPNEDSDSFMDEINLSFNPDNLVPPGIEEDDDDSERDMLIHEELIDNYSLSLLVIESFYFDILSFSRPPEKPPDGNTGILNIKTMGDIFDQKVPMPRLMITLASNQEKSSDLVSHRGLEIFLSAKCLMMIHGKTIPILDVPLFHFYPLDQFKYRGNWVKLSDLKQALRGRHPMPIMVQYSQKFKDSCQRILSSKSSFPQLQLGIIKKERRIEEEQAAKAQNSKIPVCYNVDNDYSAITPNEPADSLIMGDEHLDTIQATESDEFIKSCVETLVPNPSESEGENGCDVPACFTTFSNILFDVEYESESSDYQSCFDEDFPEEIFSNPLFEEEIISTKIDPHHFDAESDLIESLLNRDSSIISSSLKIDSLLDKLAGELTLLKSISPGIDRTDCHLENEIRFTEGLLYDNSSPRPPEEFVYENSDADIESFSPYPIPNKDSDSFMEEIDLFLTPDDPMPPSIEEDDDESERDILILKNCQEIIPFHSL
nr:hypothetical protein [Tanacetum cinerariifolium]GEY84164.1 hypothetical protein [Tanacetum cinerariifolium]